MPSPVGRLGLSLVLALAVAGEAAAAHPPPKNLERMSGVDKFNYRRCTMPFIRDVLGRIGCPKNAEARLQAPARPAFSASIVSKPEGGEQPNQLAVATSRSAPRGSKQPAAGRQ